MEPIINRYRFWPANYIPKHTRLKTLSFWPANYTHIWPPINHRIRALFLQPSPIWLMLSKPASPPMQFSYSYRCSEVVYIPNRAQSGPISVCRPYFADSESDQPNRRYLFGRTTLYTHTDVLTHTTAQGVGGLLSVIVASICATIILNKIITIISLCCHVY